MLILTPLYFLFDTIGRQTPPTITHPQYYYGFIGVALVWQFVFFVIATDPGRFRPVIGLSILEKLSFVVTVAVLALQGRLTILEWAAAIPDAILAILFIAAFVSARPRLGHA